MPTKRIPISRHRKRVTPEMVEMFARGLQIMKSGAHERLEAEGGRRGEYIDIVKQIDWRHIGPHAISVFDPMLDGPMPGYLKNYASGRDWPESVELRRALLQALEDRERIA